MGTLTIKLVTLYKVSTPEKSFKDTYQSYKFSNYIIFF